MTAQLVAECRTEQENCLYTAVSFYIWLKFLRTFRALLWAGGVVAGAFAASKVLRGSDDRLWIAGAAILAPLLPGLVKTLRLDATINAYSRAAATFNNLRAEFRRAAEIWSLKPLAEFEIEARKLFKAMNDARKPSLTPPEFCFLLARRKIEKGHYNNEDAAPAG